MNKTTENLITALENYTPPETLLTTYRLIYDSVTGKPIAVTTDITDKPNIEISCEEASAQPHLDPRLKVENGKLVKTTKRLATTEEPNRLTVMPSNNGDIVTDDYSMLIINNNGINRWNYE